MTEHNPLMAGEAVCTIATRAYLAQVRVLASSLRTEHPDLPVYVLLADHAEGLPLRSHEPFTLLPLEQMPDQVRIRQMAFYYTPFEFCIGLRPLLHQWMQERTQHSAWIYLDADIFVCGPLDPLFGALRAADIVLTPHVSHPCADNQADPLEISLIRLGVYNAGTLGLRRGPEVERFLLWFKERITRFAFSDYMGLFTDQLWLNLVPMFFRNVATCAHPGINVGYWNLHERELTRMPDGRLLANQQPLSFVHFSGWDIDRPERISRWVAALAVAPPVWQNLGRQYRQALLDAGHRECCQLPYAFASFDDGRPILPQMRRMYFDDLRRAPETERRSPFAQAEEMTARWAAVCEERRRAARRVLGPWWRQWHHGLPGWRLRESLRRLGRGRRQPSSTG